MKTNCIRVEGDRGKGLTVEEPLPLVIRRLSTEHKPIFGVIMRGSISISRGIRRRSSMPKTETVLRGDCREDRRREGRKQGKTGRVLIREPSRGPGHRVPVVPGHQVRVRIRGAVAVAPRAVRVRPSRSLGPSPGLDHPAKPVGVRTSRRAWPPLPSRSCSRRSRRLLRSVCAPPWEMLRSTTPTPWTRRRATRRTRGLLGSAFGTFPCDPVIPA